MSKADKDYALVQQVVRAGKESALSLLDITGKWGQDPAGLELGHLKAYNDAIGYREELVRQGYNPVKVRRYLQDHLQSPISRRGADIQDAMSNITAEEALSYVAGKPHTLGSLEQSMTSEAVLITKMIRGNKQVAEGLGLLANEINLNYIGAGKTQAAFNTLSPNAQSLYQLIAKDADKYGEMSWERMSHAIASQQGDWGGGQADMRTLLGEKSVYDDEIDYVMDAPSNRTADSTTAYNAVTGGSTAALPQTMSSVINMGYNMAARPEAMAQDEVMQLDSFRPRKEDGEIAWSSLDASSYISDYNSAVGQIASAFINPKAPDAGSAMLAAAQTIGRVMPHIAEQRSTVMSRDMWGDFVNYEKANKSFVDYRISEAKRFKRFKSEQLAPFSQETSQIIGRALRRDHPSLKGSFVNDSFMSWDWDTRKKLIGGVANYSRLFKEKALGLGNQSLESYRQWAWIQDSLVAAGYEGGSVPGTSASGEIIFHNEVGDITERITQDQIGAPSWGQVQGSLEQAILDMPVTRRSETFLGNVPPAVRISPHVKAKDDTLSDFTKLPYGAVNQDALTGEQHVGKFQQFLESIASKAMTPFVGPRDEALGRPALNTTLSQPIDPANAALLQGYLSGKVPIPQQNKVTEADWQEAMLQMYFSKNPNLVRGPSDDDKHLATSAWGLGRQGFWSGSGTADLLKEIKDTGGAGGKLWETLVKGAISPPSWNPSPGSEASRGGDALEQIALDWAAKHLGQRIAAPGAITNVNFPGVKVTPDGVTEDGHLIEVKSRLEEVPPNMKGRYGPDKRTAIMQSMAESNYGQQQATMAIAGAESSYQVQILRDPKYQSMYLGQAEGEELELGKNIFIHEVKASKEWQKNNMDIIRERGQTLHNLRTQANQWRADATDGTPLLLGYKQAGVEAGHGMTKAVKDGFTAAMEEMEEKKRQRGQRVSDDSMDADFATTPPSQGGARNWGASYFATGGGGFGGWGNTAQRLAAAASPGGKGGMIVSAIREIAGAATALNDMSLTVSDDARNAGFGNFEDLYRSSRASLQSNMFMSSQDATRQFQSFANIKGGMEIGDVGGAVNLVTATRGLVTLQDIQGTDMSDPDALSKLAKTVHGRAKDRGISDLALGSMAATTGAKWLNPFTVDPSRTDLNAAITTAEEVGTTMALGGAGGMGEIVGPLNDIATTLGSMYSWMTGKDGSPQQGGNPLGGTPDKDGKLNITPPTLNLPTPTGGKAPPPSKSAQFLSVSGKWGDWQDREGGGFEIDVFKGIIEGLGMDFEGITPNQVRRARGTFEKFGADQVNNIYDAFVNSKGAHKGGTDINVTIDTKGVHITSNVDGKQKTTTYKPHEGAQD